MTDCSEKTGDPEGERPPIPAIWRFLPALLIVAGALAYYGSYWRYWFNPHDEGGTVCLVAQRLLNGERPWVDIDPGYNIGWFYPVVWLFHFTGVSYLAARAWFFALATLTALLGCAIVTRVSKSRWLGLGVGLLLVALPGSQFKDYIPLSEAANTACLIFLAGRNPALSFRWLGNVVISGIVLGLTYLVRAEIGIFFSVIWIGVFVLLLLDHRLIVARRAICSLAGAACLVAGVLLPNTPALLYFRSIGVGAEFTQVYSNWLNFFRHTLTEKPPVKKTAATEPQTVSEPSSPAALSPPKPPSATPSLEGIETTDSSTLHREPLSGIWRATGRSRLLPILTYAPFLGFALFVFLGMASLAWTVFRRNFSLAGAPMQWLLLTGGSLTTFPQFFLFRPDRPHLSEFMPGFVIAMAAGVWLLWPRGGSPSAVRRTIAWACASVLSIHLLLFAFFAFEHPSAGTIAARKGRKTRFTAENGVNLSVSKREFQSLSMVRDAVLQHSRADDYLVCFPYMPGYNLMTNRRTYYHNVYVDNATRSSNWSEETIREFETKRPAVVVIDDRKINGLDASRFSQWAASVYAWLKKNYTRVGRFDVDRNERIEVFALPSPVTPDPSPAQ